MRGGVPTGSELVGKWPVLDRGGVDAECGAPGRARGGSGLMFCGGSGMGKSAAARELLAQNSGVGHWVSAVAEGRDVAMGALAAWLGETPSNPLAGLSAVRRRLGEGGARPLLVIDDAHHLDEQSAWMVHQLAVHDEARLVITVSTAGQAAAPDALNALWKDGFLCRVNLAPFTVREVRTVLEAALGGPVQPDCVRRLWALADGNPSHLRHLVTDSVASGTLERLPEGWGLSGEPVIGAELLERAGIALADLDAPAARSAALVSICGRVRLSVLEQLVDPDAVLRAESASVLRAEEERGQIWVAMATPLLRHAAQRRLAVLEVRALRGELVNALAPEVSGRRGDAALRAELCVASDRTASPELLVEGAADAVQMMRFRLAGDLARRAVARVDTPNSNVAIAATVVLARALSCLGRGLEAEHELASLNVDALTEQSMAAVTALRIANLFWVQGDVVAAGGLLDAARRSAQDPDVVAGLDGLDAAISMYQGELGRAMSVAERVCLRGDVPAWGLAWAAFAGVGAGAVMGQVPRVPDLLETGLAAAREMDSLLYFQIGYADVQGLIFRGEMASARSRAAVYVTAAHSDDFGPRPAALGHIIAGAVELGVGAAERAVDEFSSAVRLLNEAGIDDWRSLAIASLGQARAMLGVDEADSVAAESSPARRGLAALFVPGVVLKSAWMLANRGRTDRAHARLWEAVLKARGQKQFAVEATALHLAVRFGATDCVERLMELAQAAQGGGADLTRTRELLVVIAAEHATAWAVGDAESLEEISVKLEAQGNLLAAADASAQASALYEREDETRRQNYCAARAHWLASRCGRVSTPALRLAARRKLTTREIEIIDLAAANRSNREIADELELSVRTVEGHLMRACEKLGVAGRRQIPDVREWMRTLWELT